MKIIGLMGYAQVGKDTAAAGMKGWKRFAFADALKRDVAPLLSMVGCDLKDGEQKTKARPVLVSWGATARAFDPMFWVKRLEVEMERWMAGKERDPRVIITDVRYLNEVRWIIDRGGIVVRIVRPGYGPANEEEALSFKAIEMGEFRFPVIWNNGTAQSLGKQVLKVASSLGILS